MNCQISEVDDSVSEVGSPPGPSAEDGEDFSNADGDETVSEASTVSQSTKRPLDKCGVQKAKKEKKSEMSVN